MTLSADRQSHPDFWKRILPLLTCAVILISAFGAAVHDHLLYEKGCVLCKLSIFTPAVEAGPPCLPSADGVAIFFLPDTVFPFLEVLASDAASRSPPLSL